MGYQPLVSVLPPRPRGSRADRSHDEVIIVACGDKPVYGYRRVAWRLWRKRGVTVNGSGCCG